MPWLVTVQNNTEVAVLVSPSAVYRNIPQLEPIDYASLAILVKNVSTNDPWVRAGRIVLDLSAGASFAGATATAPGSRLRWGNTPLLGLTAFVVFAPYIAQRFRGVPIPIEANIASLGWQAPVSLQAGDSTTQKIFTAFWNAPQPITFVIDVSKASTRKVVQ
jgi:hypothetical protein